VHRRSDPAGKRPVSTCPRLDYVIDNNNWLLDVTMFFRAIDSPERTWSQAMMRRVGGVRRNTAQQC
jgi:hypothetical protein